MINKFLDKIKSYLISTHTENLNKCVMILLYKKNK